MPLGEVSEITVQPKEPKPLPKKDKDIKSSITAWAGA